MNFKKIRVLFSALFLLASAFSVPAFAQVDGAQTLTEGDDNGKPDQGEENGTGEGDDNDDGEQDQGQGDPDPL